MAKARGISLHERAHHTDAALGELPIVAVAVQEAQLREHRRRDGVPARRCVVLEILRPVNQLFVIVGRVEEAAVLLVEEALEHQLGQLASPVHPASIEGRFVERQQPLGEVGVVLQVGVVLGFRARFPGPEEPPRLSPHRLPNELGVGDGRVDVVRASESPPRLRKRREHEAVPRRQDFVVEPRPDSRRTDLVKLRSRRRDASFDVVRLEAHLLRQAAWVEMEGQDVVSFPIAFIGYAVDAHEQIGIRVERFADLVRRPDVELPFFSFAVGVEAAVEAAVFVPHFSKHPIERFLGDAPIELVARHLPRMQVDPRELRIVVQHLFEVRNQPASVDRVAGKAAANLIVHSALRHHVERLFDHRQGGGVGITQVHAQHKLQRHRGRKLRRSPKPAKGRVEARLEAPERALKDRAIHRPRVEAHVGERAELVGHFACAADDVLAVVVPRRLHASQDLPKARHAVPWLVREIRAGIERLSVGRQEHGHRPTASTRHRGRRLHVDAVDVGPLFSVDLHVDEVRVHLGCGGLVLERLVGHHVAPMASGVANAQQNRLVLCLGERHRFVAPRIPIDGVVDVLQQVGAGLVLQMVRHACIVFGAGATEVNTPITSKQTAADRSGRPACLCHESRPRGTGR